MADIWLPELERDPHGRALAYTDTGEPKGCLHTTETTGWPDYAGWTVPPQITVMPVPGVGVKGRQHIPLNRAGFALRNLPGGVQTNTDNVVQVELIGTCERGGRVHKAGGYLWPDADDAVLADLYRKVILPVSVARRIPVRALRFQAYDASYGARSGTNNVRLTGPDWDTYSGWLGHQHAPENLHGDPGAFPWDRMIALTQEDDVTEDDIDKIIEGTAAAVLAKVGAKVWGADVIPNTVGSDREQNPTYAAKNVAAATFEAAIAGGAASKSAAAAAVAATEAAGRTEAAVKALALGGIDVDAVASAVADKLAARLKD